MAFLEALAVTGQALGGHPTGYIDGFFACARYIVDLSRSWDSMSVMLRVGSFDFVLKDVDIDLKKMKQEVGLVGSRYLLPKVAERKPH